MYKKLQLILTAAVFINYVNYRFVKKQATYFILLVSFLISIMLIFIKHYFGGDMAEVVTRFVSGLNFREIVINFMLGMLLFAGSLTIDATRLRKTKWEVLSLSIITTLVSSFICGTFFYYVAKYFGFNLSFLFCMLFGSLISPTDTVAILNFFKKWKVPKKISMTILGESLFNDAFGVVLFVSLYSVVFSTQPLTVLSVVKLFVFHSVGGIVLGLVLSLISHFLIKPIDDYKTEILLTLAIVMGGYYLSEVLAVSGPLAMVTVGIFIASNRSLLKNTRETVEGFWEIIDELLNAMLFLLIGLEVLVVPFSYNVLSCALIMIPLIVLGRLLSVYLPMDFLKRYRNYPRHSTKILTWGGLRGGLSLALAFALPIGEAGNLILSVTYVIVIFSILVQGSVLKSLLKKYSEIFG